ncbi:allantoinase PuuE [Mesorhizobium sp. SP-1A]|uniref:allantoinase PuuE n=1 Tax=Mesorhizobium sp. SP-1A TaxID=3077840 RepID=UPI0028F74EAF|nr:allantoinase PuuE [Mesorhizobium sp. SP-1A]
MSDKTSLADEQPYPRDLVGYADKPPAQCWPNGARLAVQFVVNYEEGGENSVLHGDAKSESYLTEIVGTQPLHQARSLTIESLYEYGSRVGFWRLLRLFNDRGLKFTAFTVAMALKRNPRVAQALAESGHEIASHGWRWIDYHDVDEATERQHLRLAIDTITELTGSRPLGWYTGRVSPNTRRLVAEEGGFLYDADSYSDDLPYWEMVNGKPQLIVPYTLDVNDMKFGGPQGFNSGDQFFAYLKDSFDCLYAEGETQGRMMSVGLHCRIAGKPGRIQALTRFLDYIEGFEDVWICRRIDIARHWRERYPFDAEARLSAA